MSRVDRTAEDESIELRTRRPTERTSGAIKSIGMSTSNAAVANGYRNAGNPFDAAFASVCKMTSIAASRATADDIEYRGSQHYRQSDTDHGLHASGISNRVTSPSDFVTLRKTRASAYPTTSDGALLDTDRGPPTPSDDVNRNPVQSHEFKDGSHFMKMLEMDIFFKNRIVVRLDMANGQLSNFSCRELVDLLLEEPEVGIPKNSSTKELFALWLVSPLFEVQLKPDHKPLHIWRKWPELLSKYTTATAEKREKDQPYLSFQRDVFCPRRDEIRFCTGVVLELLYEEAKNNVLSGRYPCDQATIERLAGMQARIELGKFDPDIHTMSYFKSKLESFVPAYACRPRRSSIFNFGSKSGLEYPVWLQFRAASDDLSAHYVMRQYLDLCHALPFYGGAFFVAQIEKPVSGLAAIVGYRDLPVVVAVNADGVTIISQTEGQVLLGLKYQELSWDSARPAHENNPDCLPCLFLQFQALEGGQRVFKVLQVFSKQAILMDAIISSFVRALRQRSWDRDEVDDNSETATTGECTPDGEDPHTPLTTDNSLYGSNSNNSESTCLNTKLQRLSLATFNEDGDCIKLMGSWAFR